MVYHPFCHRSDPAPVISWRPSGGNCWSWVGSCANDDDLRWELGQSTVTPDPRQIAVQHYLGSLHRVTQITGSLFTGFHPTSVTVNPGRERVFTRGFITTQQARIADNATERLGVLTGERITQEHFP